MTLTTLSNKSFGKLFQWAFKRNKTIIIVFSILMLLGITGVLYMLFELHAREYNGDLSGTISSLSVSALSVAQFGALAFTFLSAIRTFSFLHNKRSVDMFGALPATRETLFLSHLLGGMTAVAVPYTGGSLIVALLTMSAPGALGTGLLMILFGLIGIAAAYTFTAMVAYCCGTSADVVIITLTANVSFAGIVLVLYSMMASMIPGITMHSLWHTPLIALLSPYAFTFLADKYYFSSETASFIFILVWIVLFAVLMFAAGLRAAKKHKAECAQGEVIVKWMPVTVKSCGSVVCGGLIGIGAATAGVSGSGNMGSFVFWYLIVSFIAFIILHFIFSRGFKSKFIPSLIAYGCTTAVVIGLSFLMTTGMGIDTYVPDPASVSSVAMGNDEFKDPDNIKIVTEIHQVITEGIRKENTYPYYFGSDQGYNTYYNEENEYNSFQKQYPLLSSGFLSNSFVYNKAFGFTTERDYSFMYYPYNKSFDSERIELLLQKLVNSDEYKKNRNEVLWNKELRSRVTPDSPPTLVRTVYLPEPYAEGAQNDYRIDLPSDEAFLNGLYDAIAEDILADKEYYKCLTDYGDEEVDEFGMDTKLMVEISLRPKDQNNFMDYYSLNTRIPTRYTHTLSYLHSHQILTDGTTGYIS